MDQSYDFSSYSKVSLAWVSLSRLRLGEELLSLSLSLSLSSTFSLYSCPSFWRDRNKRLRREAQFMLLYARMDQNKGPSVYLWFPPNPISCMGSVTLHPSSAFLPSFQPPESGTHLVWLFTVFWSPLSRVFWEIDFGSAGTFGDVSN